VTVLTLILTHLQAPLVTRQLGYLQRLCPDSRFAVCHGGDRGDFDQLPPGAGVFVADPSLRGPHYRKSLNQTLAVAYDTYVRDDPAVDLIYVIEYDHAILRADFERRLVELAATSPAGLFAKNASPRNDSNWLHFLQVRDDQRLASFVAAVSRRGDAATRWGCLGTGMLIRREALEAFCALVDPPPYYVELFVPTMIYHLGFEVVNVDAVSDLYGAVRWTPEFDLHQLAAERRAGRTFVHPFKRLEELDAIGAPSPSARAGQA
jgi:hypothetical protein